MRKLELLSAFALPGEQWVCKDSLHLLEDLPDEKIQELEAAGCVRWIETETFEAPALPELPAVAEEPLPATDLPSEEHE